MAEGGDRALEAYKQQLIKVGAGQEVQVKIQQELAPYTDCANYLAPAPAAICLVGQLMLIATKEDFALRVDKFEFIKYPKSFRGCLVQVADEARNAFMSAHTNMGKIGMLAAGLPTEFAEVLEIIMEQSEFDDEKMDFLLMKVQGIREIAEKCKKYAEEPEADFNRVSSLVSELKQGTVATKDPYEQDQKQAKAAKKAAEFQKNELKLLKKERDAKLQQICKNLTDADAEVMKTLKAMPSIWETIGLTLLDDLRDGIGLLTLKPLRQLASGVKKGGEAAVAMVHQKSEAASEIKREHKESLLRRVEKAVTFSDGMVKFCIDTKGQETKLRYPDDESEINLRSVASVLAEDQACLAKMPSGISFRDDVVQLCARGHGLCKSVLDAKGQDDAGAQIVTEIYAFNAKAKSVFSDVKAYVDKAKPVARPAEAAPRQQSSTGAEKSFAQAHIEQATAKHELAKSVQKNLQERYDVYYQESKQESEQITELMLKIKAQRLQEIHFGEILETLQEGVTALSDLQAKWSKIVMFFTHISAVITNLLTARSHAFCKALLVGGEEEKVRIPKAYAFKSLYRTALEAVGYSEAVLMLTTNYVSLSSDHLLPAVTSLDEILACDPKKDGVLIELKKSALMDVCKDATVAIREKCDKSHADFKLNLAKQTKAFERRLLGP